MSQKVISISPSVLNSIQYFLDNQDEPWGKSVEDLVKELSGKFVPNEAMSRGSAYGWLLENGPEKYRVQATYTTVWGTQGSLSRDMWADVEEVPGVAYAVHEKQLDKVWCFTEEEVAPIIEYRRKNPYTAYEVKRRLQFKIDGETIIMDLRVDGLNLPLIDEFKTSSKKKKPKDRKGSAQWRAYLVAFPDATAVRYGEFQFLKRDRKVVHRESYFERYPGLQEDLEGMIRQALPFIKGNPEVLKARTRIIEDK